MPSPYLTDEERESAKDSLRMVVPKPRAGLRCWTCNKVVDEWSVCETGGPNDYHNAFNIGVPSMTDAEGQKIDLDLMVLLNISVNLSGLVEGMAADLIRAIQDARKVAGLDIMAYIDVHLNCDNALKYVLEEHVDKIVKKCRIQDLHYVTTRCEHETIIDAVAFAFDILQVEKKYNELRG